MTSRLLLECAFAALLPCVALAAPSPTVRESVAVCDPNSPANCAAPDATGKLPVTTSASSTTPNALAASSVGTGGQSVTIVSGGSTGGYVTNPPTAAAQGIAAAENLYVDYANTPGSTDATCNNTCTILQPGQTYGWSALANSVTIKVNAASSGHVFSGAK